MAEPIYRLRDICQRYEKREVLHIGSLEVFEGEILGIIGPSGAGKSTLLRLLNFLEPPGEGVIFFKDIPFCLGQPVSTEIRRRVTTVFQQPFLLNRSVAANVHYGLRLRKNTNGHSLVDSALKRVGLDQMADQRARTLSAGEAQRVSLARALVIRPDVLLLDEPTANLDPYNVGIIEKIISQTNREQKTTIVLVTHNVFQAKRLAHRIALLLDGRIVEIAEAQTFFESPSDPRTAAFVGGEMVY